MSKLDGALQRLDGQLAGLDARGPIAPVMARFRADLAALRFHLAPRTGRRPILAILGGTGTGKSTLVNRLLGRDVSAASFRRTFTAGAIAIAAIDDDVPKEWLGVEHRAPNAGELPARGQADKLIVVAIDSELTRHIVLVDTPDLDGDQPSHHAQADRVFRWADALLFLVTPEKYQMTELVPYYRLARRYALPALFVMNKVEQQAAVDDCRAMLLDERRAGDRAGAGGGESRGGGGVVYAVPRDDAAYEPPVDMNLEALRAAMSSLPTRMAAEGADADALAGGLRHRAADLFDRLLDQIISPLLAQRRQVDRIVAMLRAMEAPAPGVDVNPITRQLARRLQQRSILYLMGPQRVLDRVRQVPALLARLPRTAWDLMMRGKADLASPGELSARTGEAGGAPDFPALLAEQLTILQSRIDDCIRASDDGGEHGGWIEQDAEGYAASRIDPARAATIAEEEIGELRAWLEKRWNATPRDTRILQKLVKMVPGGQKLTQWSETAPYLLTIIVATHHVFFGHVDLMILGGYSAAMWLVERLSNEVAARTRQANRAISDRFAQLAHEQIEKSVKWLQSRAPTIETLEELIKSAESLQSGGDR